MTSKESFIEVRAVLLRESLVYSWSYSSANSERTVQAGRHLQLHHHDFLNSRMVYYYWQIFFLMKLTYLRLFTIWFHGYMTINSVPKFFSAVCQLSIASSFSLDTLSNKYSQGQIFQFNVVLKVSSKIKLGKICLEQYCQNLINLMKVYIIFMKIYIFI